MIKIINTSSYDEKLIYKYILKDPNSLFYTSPNYLKLISSVTGSKIYYLIALKNEKISGVLPYMVKIGPIGKVFNSLPYFGSNGGVILEKNDMIIKSRLINEFYSIASKKDVISATIITNPFEKHVKVYESISNLTFRDTRISLMTHLQKNMTEEGFIKKLDNPRPRNIRKALKEGIIVTEDRSELSLKFLYKTHQKNITAINGIPKSKNFFLKINSFLRKKDWKLFIAKKNDLTIAALLLFYFNETVEYYTPAILEEYRNTQASSLIILKAMMDAANSGYKNWNWGGTWLEQGGVYDYKKKWATDKYSYYYFNKVFEKNILNKDINFFLKNYSGFYVLPFNKLKIETNKYN